MCGIVGRVNANARVVERDALERATRLLAHRGPDGEGVHLDGPAGLGNRRLAIVDIGRGVQPMSNEDHSVWVTFNGEIYNHRLLRAELEAHGHVFATRSDTEVLVHGYEQWGEELPNLLRGMFAFAIWDARAQQLVLVRDRLGVKPVYWTHVGSDLLFASEIKALFAFADVPREVETDVLPAYFALRYVPGPRTAFRGIERLQPGHILTYRFGELRIKPFWDLPIGSASLADRHQRDEVQESETLAQFIQESVRLRLMGEVPVGTFLSGGIDSTTITWAMQQQSRSAVRSFSVGYEGDSEDERTYARMASRAIGTQHEEVVIGSDAFLDNLDQLVWHLDEPNSDGACIPLMLLSRRARQDVVVVLSGEGADEVLAGYGIYGKMLAIERLRALGVRVIDPLLGVAHESVTHRKLRSYIGLARKPLERRYFGVGRAFDDGLMSHVFGREAVEALADQYAEVWQVTRGSPPLNRMLYADTKVYLPDDLLIKADKMTMAAGVELRVPFLDHQLVEYAWSLPTSFKRRGLVGKYLLRTAMAEKLPRPILKRPKQGFPVPLRHWLSSSLYEACHETLLATQSSVRGLLGARTILGLLEEHRAGRSDRTEELYAMWVYEAWHRAFLTRPEWPV
jgi:asparagine synthase (glutamine-hydrolysing)